MKKIFAVCWLAWGCAASANPNWLTIVGDPLNPAVAIIQIDLNAAIVASDQRTMFVRVSRPQERTSNDGVIFRSYHANVLFDCSQKSARFVSVDFYEQALWQGKPHKSMTYGPTQIRPLVFRFFEPNPLEKLVRAACPNANASGSGTGTGNGNGNGNGNAVKN